MELWDAYDRECHRITGLTLVRGEAIGEGVYHLACEVIVQHWDGSYLLMRRDWGKERGGKWELSAGGSAWQGETPLDCARRELKEETGISASNIQEIGWLTHEEYHTHFVIFLCIYEGAKDAITLQKRETIAYQWVDIHALSEMEDQLAFTRSLDCLRNRNR